MTKQIILPMNEISDSVKMLHEKPNKGMPVFTWILVLLLAAALIWCSIGEIDYFIKASGIVRPGENVSTISSHMTGRVDLLNFLQKNFPTVFRNRKSNYRKLLPILSNSTELLARK